MAQKRMFSLQIVDTDAFLDMPLSTQAFYFHLVMRADDEGFVSNPKKIMRLIGSQDDDLKILIGKRFILTFESGVVVIKHWLIHNAIRMDRFNKTAYQDERKTLEIKENNAYTEISNQVATIRQPKDNQSATQVKLSKDKLSKEREEHTLEFLKNIPDEVIKEFSTEFNVYEQGIKGKADDLYNYCLAKGKRYKNYKAFLRNAVKKDFGLRPKEAPKVWEQAQNQQVSQEGLKKFREMKKNLNFGIKK